LHLASADAKVHDALIFPKGINLRVAHPKSSGCRAALSAFIPFRRPILTSRWVTPTAAGRFCVLLLALSAAVPISARSGTLVEQLDLIQQLNATSHWRSGRSILEEIEPQLARASASQRNRYDLLMAHNLALGGSTAAALELIEQVKRRRLDPRMHLTALWMASNLATAERSYERAFAYIKEGMALLPEVEDPGARAGLLGMAGRLYAEAGEVEQGVAMARQALEYAGLAEAGTHGSSQCAAGQRLAVALGKKGSLDAQLDAASQALEHCQREQNGHFSAALESLLGELHLQGGDLDAAERWLGQALDRSTSMGFVTGQMRTRLRLLQLGLERGDPMPDAATIDQMVSHFRTRRFWEPKALTHQLVARFAENSGDYPLAIEHLQREAVARERLASRQRSLRSAYLEVQYDRDTRRRELDLLQEQARVSALEQTTHRQGNTLRQVAQWGGGILIALLGVGLYQAARERRHYQNLSLRDSLTELLNHTSFFDAADRALTDCIGRQQAFTLAVGDIDHFKQINDRHGHLAGDTVLRRVASRMRAAFPHKAILGRVGGEEFAIAIPGEALHVAQQRLDSLRQQINTSRRGEQDWRVSMSFGVAEFNGAETIEQLRRRADQALYRAKEAGRDCVVSADDH
jgi:diguanylate cyclase (GGDEF)-like protein